jgi:hypothetical protein
MRSGTPNSSYRLHRASPLPAVSLSSARYSRMLDLALADDAPLGPEWEAGLAGGVVTLRGEARHGSEPAPLRTIPY